MDVSTYFASAYDLASVEDSATFIQSTVTDSDVYTGKFKRVPNTMLGWRLDLATGPAAVWVKLNATACAAVRCRLYQSGGRGKPVSKARRMYLESGRAGEKAAKWASDSEDLVEVETHPVLDALNAPNAWQAGHSFTWQRYWLREATGNAFVFVDHEAERPTLHNMNPRWVQIVPSRSMLIEAYRYGREDSIVQSFTPDQVCHYRLYDGEDPYHGATWVTDVAEAIQVLKANYAHQERFIRSGMLPPFALKISPTATEQQVEEIRRELRRHHSGLSKWTEPLLMRNADVVMMPAEPNKYQTLEQLEAFRRDIRNAAGVPESMADVNDANVASATVGYDQQYLGTTIAPRVQRMCADDTVYLLPHFGVEPGDMFFAPDEIVLADDAAMLERHRAAVGGPWMLANEARREWGQEELPEFSKVSEPVANEAEEPEEPEETEATPEPEAPSTPDAPEAPLPQALNGAHVTAALEVVTRVANGEIPRDAGVAMLREFFGLDQTKAESIMGSAGTGAATTPNVNPAVAEPAPNPEPETPVAKAFDWLDFPCGCVAHKSVSAVNLTPKVETAASALEAKVRDWFAEYGGQATVTGNGAVMMSTEARSALEAILRPALLEVLRAGVMDNGGDAPDGFTPKVPESYVVRLASKVTESTQNALTAAIRSGVEEGLGLNELQQRVSAAASDLSGEASYRIARTEGAYASEEARQQLDIANGATHHEWDLAAGGCAVCAEFEATYGTVRPITEPYAVAGTSFEYVDEGGTTRTFTVWRDVTHPPLHPQCRCTDKTVEVKRALD